MDPDCGQRVTLRSIDRIVILGLSRLAMKAGWLRVERIPRIREGKSSLSRTGGRWELWSFSGPID